MQHPTSGSGPLCLYAICHTLHVSLTNVPQVHHAYLSSRRSGAHCPKYACATLFIRPGTPVFFFVSRADVAFIKGTSADGT